jgi:hypothetical protein
MRCPNCDSENNDSAKFCKKCGTPLNKAMTHESVINSVSGKSSSDNTATYIIVALIVIAIVLAGAFVYIYGFGSSQSNDSQPQDIPDSQDISLDDEPTEDEDSQSSQSTPEDDEMSILGGSFSTDGGLEDKTYASIFVGPEHAGEKVKVQIFYSRDGSSLNNGNMVPKTVNSNGYIEVASAEAYKYFPDHADINLYDNSGNLLDTMSVSLSPESGTQTF